MIARTPLSPPTPAPQPLAHRLPPGLTPTATPARPHPCPSPLTDELQVAVGNLADGAAQAGAAEGGAQEAAAVWDAAVVAGGCGVVAEGGAAGGEARGAARGYGAGGAHAGAGGGDRGAPEADRAVHGAALALRRVDASGPRAKAALGEACGAHTHTAALRPPRASGARGAARACPRVAPGGRRQRQLAGLAWRGMAAGGLTREAAACPGGGVAREARPQAGAVDARSNVGGAATGMGTGLLGCYAQAGGHHHPPNPTDAGPEQGNLQANPQQQ
jgi:hypothetical protein